MMADDSGAGAPSEPTTPTAGAPEAPVSVSGQETAAPAAGGTLLGGAPADPAAQPPVAAPADWPEDWRTKVAGEDAKELARLQRMGSPADVWKAYRALEAKLSEKGGKPTLGPPEGATPEQVAAWRKEAGLPEAPEGYVPDLGDGLVIGEADKPLVDGFKAAALDANMTPAQFNKALNWYYAQQDQIAQQQQAADVAFKTQAEEQLRQEWGGEFLVNKNGAEGILAQFFPAEVTQELLNARTPSGHQVGTIPGFIKALALLSREINPALPHIPNGSGNPMKATEDRIAEINRMIAANDPAYWTNEKVQAEYRDLLSAQQKMQARSAA